MFYWFDKYFVVVAFLISIIGLIGYFKNVTIFYICGSILFLSFIAYLVLASMKRQINTEIEIMRTGTYQRSKNSPIFKARDAEELRIIIGAVRKVTYLSKFLVLLLFCLTIYLIFKWDGFVWVGIIFGFFYIPEFLRIINKKKKPYSPKSYKDSSE